MGKGLNKIIKLIYPSRCPICNQIVIEKEICKLCEQKIRYIKEPICKKCGKSIYSELEEYCYDCQEEEHYYDQGRGAFLYNGEMQSSIYQFKYNNKREYAKFYARTMAVLQEKWVKELEIDRIIPVPISNRRKSKRGYNQAEIISKKLSKYFDIPTDTKMLKRTKNTDPLKLLSKEKRKKELKNAFVVINRPEGVKKVLLIDDIYTTGSTMSEVAKVLKDSGIESVYFLVVCIGQGY